MRPLEALVTAAALYWALTAVFTFFQSRLERKMSKGYVRTVAGPRTRERTKMIVTGSGGGQGHGAPSGYVIDAPDDEIGVTGHPHAGGLPTAPDPEEDPS